MNTCGRCGDKDLFLLTCFSCHSGICGSCSIMRLIHAFNSDGDIRHAMRGIFCLRCGKGSPGSFACHLIENDYYIAREEDADQWLLL